jgi:hypothetical protein
MATYYYNADSAHHSHLVLLRKLAACNDRPAALTHAEVVSRDIYARAMFGLPARALVNPINLIRI